MRSRVWMVLVYAEKSYRHCVRHRSWAPGISNGGGDLAIFDRASTEGAVGESPSSPSYDTSLRVLGLPTRRRASVSPLLFSILSFASFSLFRRTRANHHVARVSAFLWRIRGVIRLLSNTWNTIASIQFLLINTHLMKCPMDLFFFNFRLLSKCFSLSFRLSTYLSTCSESHSFPRSVLNREGTRSVAAGGKERDMRGGGGGEGGGGRGGGGRSARE